MSCRLNSRLFERLLVLHIVSRQCDSTLEKSQWQIAAYIWLLLQFSAIAFIRGFYNIDPVNVLVTQCRSDRGKSTGGSIWYLFKISLSFWTTRHKSNALYCWELCQTLTQAGWNLTLYVTSPKHEDSFWIYQLDFYCKIPFDSKNVEAVSSWMVLFLVPCLILFALSLLLNVS